MSTEEKTIETTVTQEEVNLDEIFNGAPGADTITLPEKTEKPNIFSREETIDPSFLNDTTETEDIISEDTTDVDEKAEEKEDENAPVEEKQLKADAADAFAAIDKLDTDEEEPTLRKTKGMAEIFGKLIKEEKLIGFDDEKSLDEYSGKDWEELLQANFEEQANAIRRETPQQFFQSLPQELQIAARYVADGGQDLKGLFSALSTVEETKELDVKNEQDQSKIIKEYLTNTGYGTVEEIDEEIEIWKDLGKLESQASKFKPKLDKMQESVVAKRLQEQEMRLQQQQKASQDYMQNVYETLKGGHLGDIRLDKKTQSLLYNGLVQPNYPSINGKNTNLLGHLLERYQFVEPNYQLVTEALWLLSDPNGYKSKIMEKGAQRSVEKTVRKLKTEQSNRTGGTLADQADDATRPMKRKLPRGNNNIFKRF
jgi:hypothetical protein